MKETKHVSVSRYAFKAGLLGISLLLAMAFMKPIAAEAQEMTSWINFNSCVSYMLSGNYQAWVNPANARTSDNLYASSTITSQYPAGSDANLLNRTKVLKCTEPLNLNIPDNAKVVGIEFKVEKKQSGWSVSDRAARLVRNGEILDLNKAKAAYWPKQDTTYLYGGSNDTWGQIWTPADFDTDFGVAFQAHSRNGEILPTAYVDNMAARIYYELPVICDGGYYLVNETCQPVGTGYWAAAGSNVRVACANHRYTAGKGTGADSIDDCLADTDYYGTNHLVAAGFVGIGYFSPYRDDNRYACANQSINSHYTSSGNGTNNCSWECNDGYMELNGECVIITTNGELFVQINSNTPSSKQIQLGQAGVELMRVNLSAENEDIKLNNLTVKIADPTNPDFFTGPIRGTNKNSHDDVFEKLYLYQGINLVGAGQYVNLNGIEPGYVQWNWSNGSSAQPIIPVNTTQIFTIKADLNASNSTSIPEGLIDAPAVRLTIQDGGIQATGSPSSANIIPTFNGLVLSNHFYPYDVLPYISLSSDPVYGPKGSASSNMKIFGFNVSASINSADTRTQSIVLNSIKLKILGNVDAENFRLFDASDDSEIVIAANSGVHDENSSSSNIVLNLATSALSDREMQEGTIKSYYVKADVHFNQQGSESGTLAVEIDSPGSIGANGTYNYGDLIWSPKNNSNVNAMVAVITQNPFHIDPSAMIFSTGNGRGDASADVRVKLMAVDGMNVPTNKLMFYFSDGVYGGNSQNHNLNLSITDFAFVDANSSGVTISSVTHTAGSSYGFINLSGPWSAGDTLNAANYDDAAGEYAGIVSMPEATNADNDVNATAAFQGRVILAE